MSSSSKLSAADSDRRLRDQIRPLRGKSTVRALAIAAIDVSFYIISFTMAVRHADSWLGVAFGLLTAVATGTLFVVGHDACHGSFTGSPILNAWIGRIVFLPSLTPFSPWDTVHNQTHHPYTNLKTYDYVWAPFSKAEFDRLPAWRRGLERIYRSVPGVGLYYWVEIWCRHLLFPRNANGIQLADSALCASVAACAIAAVGFGCGWRGLATGIGIPFLVWNWMIGWAIFEQHTHPAVPWFADETRWRAERSQSRCTVHIVLPGPLDFLFHHVFHHTAHHLDVTIPLYRLRRAQEAVEAIADKGLVVYSWSPQTFVKHVRHCRLYDFENQRWLDFDGAPSR